MPGLAVQNYATYPSMPGALSSIKIVDLELITKELTARSYIVTVFAPSI